ncbi:hypothetical protein FGO68_gene15167 [Halteria grandinella]|uniref:Fe2OG dioxygenase domain-containing protein n=1 Tax=Halteria grandinella TaxID=5974 RepID=A0A8J8NQJ3_HALGN|nr:hypothetical protein FGO68_gene15167 [Halteria grandinella]
MAVNLKNIKSLLKQKAQPKEEVKQDLPQSAVPDYSKLFCEKLLSEKQPRLDLESYKVPGTDTAYYIKDYLNKEQEQTLLHCIFNLDQERWFEMKSGRALKRYGGEVGPTGLQSQEPLPPYFEAIARGLYERGLFPCEHGAPNHILLNKYKPGDGIMPHKDGPAYHPFVCILSLNSGLILNIWETLEDSRPSTEDGIPKYKARFYLEPRSLFIFTEKHYLDHFHGIEEAVEDRISNDPASPWYVHNLTMTNLTLPNKGEESEQLVGAAKQKQGGEAIIERSDFRLSLTIRYVPLSKE